MTNLGFASFEGHPCRYGDNGVSGAWWFKDGRWTPVNSAEVYMGAAVMSERAFLERFGFLPPLLVHSR
jgi:hypothetical protein